MLEGFPLKSQSPPTFFLHAKKKGHTSYIKPPNSAWRVSSRRQENSLGRRTIPRLWRLLVNSSGAKPALRQRHDVAMTTGFVYLVAPPVSKQKQHAASQTVGRGMRGENKSFLGLFGSIIQLDPLANSGHLPELE